MMKTKSKITVLLVHVLPLFGILTQLLCQETSELKTTNITATINSLVTFQCLVHNPHLTLWLLQRKWCGYSSALTLGGFNFKSETYSLNIGNESDRKAYNLIVSQPSKEIEGIYICQEKGTNKAVSNLYVDTEMASEKHINVTIYSEVELSCLVYHQRFAVWIFRKNDGTSPVALSAGERIFNDEYYSLNIKTGTKFVVYNLTINTVKEETVGMYVCKEEGIERVIFKLNAEAFDTGDSTGENLTVAAYTTVTIQCAVDDYQFALWLFVPSGTRTPVTLSSGSQIFNSHNYSLIIHEEEGFTTYNLMITNTTEDMQGVYSCRERGVLKADRTLMVEVPPNVWIEIDDLKLSRIINVTLVENYELTCIASGASPPGVLSWEVNHKNLPHESTYQKSNNEISSVFQYRPAKSDMQLACIFSGQIAVPRIKVTLLINVLYPPYCHLSTSVYGPHELIVNCICDGNPEVSSFYILVNDSLHFTDRLSISSEYPVSLNCFAENDLGQLSNKPTYQYQPSSTSNSIKEAIPTSLPDESAFSIVWVISALSLILLFMFSMLFIIIFRKKRHVSSSYFTWEPTVSPVAVTSSDRPRCGSPATEHRFLSTSSEYYETVPAIGITMESDGISTDERVEYNEQYFELPFNDSEEKVYAEANNQDKGDMSADTIVVSRASSKSSFSDAEYFGPISEGGTLDNRINLLDVKYKVNVK